MTNVSGGGGDKGNQGVRASAACSGTAPLGLRPEPVPVSAIRRVSADAVERLALNLRSYAYAVGAPRSDTDEEVAIDAARLIMPKLQENGGCLNCAAAGWVCENHRDRPWGGMSGDMLACECGAGAPCPVCSPALACASYTEPLCEALARACRLIESAERETSWMSGDDPYGDSAVVELRAILARASGEQP